MPSPRFTSGRVADPATNVGRVKTLHVRHGAWGTAHVGMVACKCDGEIKKGGNHHLVAFSSAPIPHPDAGPLSTEQEPVSHIHDSVRVHTQLRRPALGGRYNLYHHLTKISLVEYCTKLIRLTLFQAVYSTHQSFVTTQHQNVLWVQHAHTPVQFSPVPDAARVSACPNGCR